MFSLLLLSLVERRKSTDSTGKYRLLFIRNIEIVYFSSTKKDVYFLYCIFGAAI